jgi:hypothetical protein
MTMTHLLTLLADCEHWLGIEPLGEEQWAEVAELRERVRAALAATESGERRLSLLVEAASFLDDVAAKRSVDGLE